MTQKNFTKKENNIGLAVSEILYHTHRDIQTLCYFIIRISIFSFLIAFVNDLERSRTESGGARDYESLRPLVDTPDSQVHLIIYHRNIYIFNTFIILLYKVVSFCL